MCTRPRLIPSALTALALLLGAPVGAEDGALRFDESALDELASEIGPLTVEGRNTIEYMGIVLCGDWEVEVRALDFRIRSTGSLLSGEIEARYNCFGSWLSATAPISGNALISYQQAQRRLRITTVSGPVPLFVRVPGWVPIIGGSIIPIPVSVDVGPSATFTLPIGTAPLYFETVSGTRLLRVTPEDVALTVGDGFVELQGDVVVW